MLVMDRTFNISQYVLNMVLVLLVVMDAALADGELFVGFLGYENEDNIDFNGKCCDGVRDKNKICSDPCDLIFEVSVRGLCGASLLPKRPTQRPISAAHVFLFPSEYKHVKDPVAFKFKKWTGDVSILITVFDKDKKASEKPMAVVDKFSFPFAPSGPSVDFIYHEIIGRRQQKPSRLRMIFRYSCDKDNWSYNCYNNSQPISNKNGLNVTSSNMIADGSRSMESDILGCLQTTPTEGLSVPTSPERLRITQDVEATPTAAGVISTQQSQITYTSQGNPQTTTTEQGTTQEYIPQFPVTHNHTPSTLNSSLQFENYKTALRASMTSKTFTTNFKTSTVHTSRVQDLTMPELITTQTPGHPATTLVVLVPTTATPKNKVSQGSQSATMQYVGRNFTTTERNIPTALPKTNVTMPHIASQPTTRSNANTVFSTFPNNVKSTKKHSKAFASTEYGSTTLFKQNTRGKTEHYSTLTYTKNITRFVTSGYLWTMTHAVVRDTPTHSSGLFATEKKLSQPSNTDNPHTKYPGQETINTKTTQHEYSFSTDGFERPIHIVSTTGKLRPNYDLPVTPTEKLIHPKESSPMWPIIVGAILGTSVVLVAFGFLIIHNRQKILQRRRSCYNVHIKVLKNTDSIRDNVTTRRSDVALETGGV